MAQNLITLPRSQLYELVWSKPVRDLAAEFGISDVALAKRCRALKIPVPGRGHWARVAAGQKPRRPPLPPFSVRKHEPRPSYVTTHAADGTEATEPAVNFDPQRSTATITVSDADLPTVTTTPHHSLQDCSGPGETHRAPLQTPAARRTHLHPRRNHRPDPPPRGLTRHAQPRPAVCRHAAASGGRTELAADPSTRTGAPRPAPLLRPSARTQTEHRSALRRPRASTVSASNS